MNNNQKIALGIVLYIFVIKIFSFLYSIVNFLGLKNNLSTTYYYLSLIGIIGISIFFFKFSYNKLVKVINKQYAIYLLAILLFIIAFIDQYTSYKLGFLIGETMSDLDQLSLPQKVKGHGYLVLHIVMLLSYKWIFNHKEGK